MTFRLGVLDQDYRDALKMVNINSLSKLDDVVEGPRPLSGQTLVYDNTVNKYVLDDIDLDGGDF
jgi:hypothetical protein